MSGAGGNSGADALLKGMLGIGISNDATTTSTEACDSNIGNKAKVTADGKPATTNKYKKKKPHQKTSPKLRPVSQGRRGSDQGAGGEGATARERSTAHKNPSAVDQKKGNTFKKKKKKNGPYKEGGALVGGGGKHHEGFKHAASKAIAKTSATHNKTIGNSNTSTPKSEQLQKPHSKYSSSEYNGANYAWSAFQSSPDPSALPDIGGLFGNDSGGVTAHDCRKGEGETEPNEDKGGDAMVTGSEAFDEEISARGVELSLNLGPPSEKLRISLVDSMVSKKGGGGVNPDLVKSMMAKKGGVNPGEALLQRLTSSPEKRRATSIESSPAIVAGEGGAKFRTMESLEAEMLSPQKTQEKSSNDKKEEKIKQGSSKEDPKKTAAAAVTDTKVPTEEGTNTEEQQTQPAQYPDPIMELMNPGGHPGGYGMQQQHQQPPHHHQMQHHQPLHYGGGAHSHHNPPLHPMHSYPGYPYPPPPPGGGGPMLHHHSPYHHHSHHPQQHQHHHPQQHFEQQHQQPLPPDNRGFTTIQARVPPVLGPGNTMLVNGMAVPVPEGVPPGAIIPVMVPAAHHPHHSHHTGHHHLQHQHHPYYYPQHAMQQHQSPHYHHHENNMIMGQQQQFTNSNSQNHHHQQPQQTSNQQQSQKQEQLQSGSNSWAAKVKNTSPSSPALTPSKETEKKISEKSKVSVLNAVSGAGGGSGVVPGIQATSAMATAKGGGRTAKAVPATSSTAADPKGSMTATPPSAVAKGTAPSSATVQGAKGHIGRNSNVNKAKKEGDHSKTFNNKAKSGAAAPTQNKKYPKKQQQVAGNGDDGSGTKESASTKKRSAGGKK